MTAATHRLRVMTCLLSTVALLPLTAMPGKAQQAATATDTGGEVEEILVTGSYIRRSTSAGAGAPISVLDRDNLKQIGASTVADVIQTLTINTGSQNNPDAFTQNFSTGTENFNLRGLGVGSTLVLLNGRRQVTSGATTDDGVSFVDTSSLIPQIAIGRLEIVKDGAAALYGSDAVAGVVNFITRSNFEGLELEAEFKAVTDQGSSSDVRVEGIAGTSFADGRGHAMASFSYLDRTSLTTQERRLSPKFGPDVSAIGQPGTFVPAALLLFQGGQLPFAGLQQQLGALFTSPGAAAAAAVGIGSPGGSASIPDPNCPTAPVAEGPFSNSITAGAPGLRTCILDFGDAFNLVPETTRIQGFAQIDYQISDAMEFYSEFAFARNRTDRNNSPTFPILNTTVIGGLAGNSLVGAPVNPFNPFNVDLFGLVRPLGFGEFPQSEHDSDTFRVAGGIRGDFSESWRYDLSFARSSNDFEVRARDTLKDRFTAALNGLGGPDCALGTSLLARGTADCQFFNPFGSANAAPAGATVVDPLTGRSVPVANSQEVLDDILAFALSDFDSRLWTADAVVAGDLGDTLALPGGRIGVAIGGQFRHEAFGLDADDNLNSGNFLFVSGAGSSIGDFNDSRDTWAGFVEVAFPFTNWLEITAAGRFENTQNIESTWDPKVSALIRPTDQIDLRASYSTSFRAPSIFQQQSRGSVTLLQVTDPLLGNTAFVGGFTTGNPDLKPEESDQFNVGFTYRVSPDFTIEMDYWNFHFKDVIVKENAQALLDAAGSIADPLQRAGALLNPARFSRALGLPLLTQVSAEFVNAPSLKTDGIDFRATWSQETPFGTVSPFIDGTLILGYTVEDPTLGVMIDGKGNRNFRNIGDPTPPLRFNAGLTWQYGAHSLFGVARYIDSFTDDQNCVTSAGAFTAANPSMPQDPCATGSELARVDDRVTFDLQYSLDLQEMLGLGFTNGLTLSAGAINVTDKKPPFVNTNSGFETRIHDPRGRLAYVRVSVGF